MLQSTHPGAATAAGADAPVTDTHVTNSRCDCLHLQVVGLYKKLGFVDDPQGIRGMAFQRKKKEKRGLF
jgi:hypothetical protein